MENKINIAELLKDCPKGMELDCVSYDNVKFMEVDIESETIILQVGNYYIRGLNKYGHVDNICYAKCIIFPKGKTTWEGFVPPIDFKDGDIAATDGGGWLGIIKNKYDTKFYTAHCALVDDSCNTFLTKGKYLFSRLATEEEKQKLFDAIKANGYRWDAETKTLEKLIEPRFKVGDNIKLKGTAAIYVVTELREDRYVLDDKDIFLLFENEDQWGLVSNKFDINTLKPFDEVLVRCSTSGKWRIQLFERYDKTYQCSFICIGGQKYTQCIPYEGNEHLLGKTDDCDNYFKTWEE